MNGDPDAGAGGPPPGDGRGPLAAALGDLARAMVLAMALSALPVLLVLTGFGGGLPARWTLGPPSTSWELAASAEGAGDVPSAALPLAGPGGDVFLEEDEAGSWLTLVAPAGEEPASAVGRLLGERGLWTGRMRLESGLSRVLRLSLADPGKAAAVFPVLVPWLFLSTGLAFLAVGLRGRRRRPLPAPTLRLPGPWARTGAGVALGVVLLLAVEGVSRVLAALGLPAAEQGIVLAVAEAGGLPWAVFAATAVLLAPPAEEVLFRGHLYRILAPRFPGWRSHLLVAILFAAVHMNPAALPAYLLYSVGLSLAYERTGSLLVPVLAHAVVNGTGIALLAAG